MGTAIINATKIDFSTDYLSVLKNMLKVFNDLPNKRHGLIFKMKDDDSNRIISSMSLNTLVTLTTDKKHVDFGDSEIGITSLSEFLNYVKTIDYPNKESEISRVTEVSTRGKSVHSFLFSGEYGTYRMPVAGLDEFDDKYDRKVPVKRDKDPLELVSKFYLSKVDLERLVNDVNMMGKADYFRLVVDAGDISIYIKGIQNQQFTRKIDSTKAQVFSNFSTKKEDDPGHYKLFPTKVLDYMSYFGCDFEVEVRRHISKKGEIIAIKAYGTLKFDSKPDMEVFIGTKESESELSAHNSDIVE
jgi:hypothetical protein